jgi:hypothetical protein
MTSIIKVDEIQTKAGAAHTLHGLGVTGSGTVLQEVYGACDGRTVSGITFENVTAIQSLTTSHADIIGSTVSYTPPAGTKTVVYTFSFTHNAFDSSGISHFQLNIDGTDVSNHRRTMAGSNHPHFTVRHVLEYPILIDSTLAANDIANLKLKSWTSAKTLKMTGREYNSSYDANLHQNEYWDGATASGANNIAIPTLSIKAIA